MFQVNKEVEYQISFFAEHVFEITLGCLNQGRIYIYTSLSKFDNFDNSQLVYISLIKKDCQTSLYLLSRRYHVCITFWTIKCTSFQFSNDKLWYLIEVLLCIFWYPIFLNKELMRSAMNCVALLLITLDIFVN